MKKLVTLLLALCLLTAAIPFAAVADEAPIKLTYGTVLPEPDFTEYEIWKELLAELNIELEFIQYDYDSLSVMLADGSFPDIMSARLEFLDSVLKSGYALNIEPYIDEYMPNMNSELYAQTNELLQMLYPYENGEIYFMCPAVGISESKGLPDQNRGYVVRWDYYKELGCPPINSIEDYVDVLCQMVENHPYDENGNQMWAYGVNRSLRDMGGYFSSFQKDISVNLWSTAYLYKAHTITNKLVNCYSDVENSSYWSDMRFQNMLYRRGVYNMDVFTMDSDEFNAMTCEGRFMGVHYVENELYKNAIKEDPNSLAAYVVVPSDSTWLYADVNLMLGNAPAYYTFINKNSKNIEAALKLWNYMYDPDFCREWTIGKQGESWDYVDGVPTMKPEYIRKLAEFDEDFVEKRGYGKTSYYIAGYMPTSLHPDGYLINLTFTAENALASQLPWQKDFAAQYGEEYWVDAQYKHMQANSYDMSETISASMTDIPVDMKRTLELCNNVLETAMPELIAAESDEEFLEIQERVLAELDELGEKECFEWFNEQWNIAREKVWPIFEASCEAQGLRPEGVRNIRDFD